MSGLINYVKKAFKNYPDTTTPINAANLNHLDNGIYELDQAVATALGSTDISSIGNGTVKGAISNIDGRVSQLNTNLTEIREEMKTMGMPPLNYTTPLYTFDANHLSYPATKECYVIGTLMTSSTSTTTTLSINNKPVLTASMGANTLIGNSDVCLRLEAGDTVSLDQIRASVLHVYEKATV